jgi:small subunit ribosomal protein S16
MVAIRLRRAGSKKRPFFRIVVSDSRGACDSSFVEILGHYNPRTKPAVVKVDAERVQYWLQRGAQPSDTVRTLMARHLTPVAAQPVVAAPPTPAAGAAAATAAQSIVATPEPAPAATAAPAEPVASDGSTP